MDNRTTKILDFLKEIEKLKLTKRIPFLSDRKTLEDDAQHSWHLAMMALALEKELDVKFDLFKTLKLILVHDLPEIYTGDAWVTEKEKKIAKSEKELIAAKKVFSSLPPDLSKEMLSLYEEYANGKTVEAKIAKALDKINYSIQYSLSKKIPEKYFGSTAKESRDYALPYTEFNQRLTEILDSFIDKRRVEYDNHSHGWIKVYDGKALEALEIIKSVPEFEEITIIEDLTNRLNYKENVKIIIAEVDGNKAGFIIGYQLNKKTHYCWLAAVAKDFRNQGVLTKIMKEYEDWAKEKGYSKVAIKTRNNRRGMLKYLINNGYQLLEVEHKDDINNYRISAEKGLSEKIA